MIPDFDAAHRLPDLDTLAARVAELEAENAHARGLIADLRRPFLPDGVARAVEMAADAYLGGRPVERTLSDNLARLEHLESENERLLSAFRRALGISDRPLTEAELRRADDLLTAVNWSALDPTTAEVEP